MKEYLRREVTEDDLPIKESCRKCGRDVELWFNGGELDHAECCNLVYELQHVRIDYVVREKRRNGNG